MRKDVATFLHETGMHYADYDLSEQTRCYMEHMKQGLLADTDKSLRMIPTFIPEKSEVPTGTEVIVLDAGGTNLRVAAVKFDESGEAVISSFNKYPMPGTQGEISLDEFYDTIAGYIEPVANVSDSIGFCFSFPSEIQTNGDGKILAFCKEVEVRGAEGSLLGVGLNEKLAARGISPKRVVVLNDAVATALGSMASGGSYSNYIGYILGTGTNLCYIESAAKIKKSPDAMAMGGRMLINTETSNYSGAKRGKFDLELDESTINTGYQLMEKMISGAYLGNLILRALRGAAGLLSDALGSELSDRQELLLYDVDQFLRNPESFLDNESDREVCLQIIDNIIERAARLTVSQLAAIMLWCGDGNDPGRPVCVTAEGTVFLKSPAFRPHLDMYIKSYLNDELKLYCEIVSRDNVTLAGSAVAAL